MREGSTESIHIFSYLAETSIVVLVRLIPVLMVGLYLVVQVIVVLVILILIVMIILAGKMLTCEATWAFGRSWRTLTSWVLNSHQSPST